MKTTKNKNIKERIFIVCMIMILSVMMSTAVAAEGSSSFATEVVSFNGPFGSSPYDDPNAVLGKPTTKWKDSWTSQPDERAKLVEAAWNVGLNDEPLITSLNEGSQITVKFDQQVMDDPDNPYGIDLLVFGNSFFAADSWVSDETNMNTCMITGGVSEECTQVSVSQDGQNWYTYESGPHGDEKFPIQAYVWDRENAQWTDIEMDWTKPVDPSFTDNDFINISAADAIDLYNGSAGGTGFDLAESGYEWIQYVRVEGVSGCCGGEIDGFADVAPLITTTTSTTSTTTSSTTTSTSTTTTTVSTTSTTTTSTSTIPEEQLIIHLRIEGDNHTIWSGDITVPESTEIYCYDSGRNYTINGTSLLAALDNASELGGFNYTVSDAWYPSMGFYVNSIAGEWASGMCGWGYMVDYYSIGMSCDNFILNETTPPDPPHKEVLWYYGGWGEYPLRLEADKTIVDACDVISVNVSYFNESDWLPLANATVYADADYLTDVNGGVNISIADSGNHSIFAEKPGYIRSDKITVEVGETTTTTSTTAPTTTSIKKSSGRSSGGRSSGGGFSAVPIRKETCFDGLMNCHDGACEEEADCGGPCEPCPSCEDRIQNQGEEGIDCGGPCTPCFTTTTASIPITSTMLTTSTSVTPTSTSTVTTTTTLVVTTTSIPAQGIGGAIAAFTAENLGVITPMVVVMLVVSAVFYKKRTRLFK